MNMSGAALIRIGLILVVLLASAFGVELFLLRQRNPDAARVVWTETHQTIDGFGGSSADFLDSLTPAQADFFFTTKGIGLSLLRTQIIPDRATCDAEFREGGCSESNGQILNGELAPASLVLFRLGQEVGNLRHDDGRQRRTNLRCQRAERTRSDHRLRLLHLYNTADPRFCPASLPCFAVCRSYFGKNHDRGTIRLGD